MRTRRRRAQALVVWLLALGAAMVVSPVHAQTVDGLPDSRFIEQREQFGSSGAPLELRFLIAREVAAQDARIVDATRATLSLLSEWFGPLPLRSLTVAGIGWRPGQIPTINPGLVSARLRWLTSARDRATERELIHGIVRQYWDGGSAASSGFMRALVSFLASRAIHQQLEGSNFATIRFFGGVVPFSLRSVLMSPPVADSRPRLVWFEDDPPIDAEHSRQLRALQTIERYVGWPTMLQAVSSLRGRQTPIDANALGQALSDARGTDLRFLVDECFRADAVFDYALADLQTRPADGGLVETSLTIARHGPGIFTTSANAAERNAIVPVRVRFTDGTEIRSFFDGAAPSVSPVYTARTAAISATVDPDAMLLLDVNRENNTITRDTRIAPLGVRLALNWMNWLQQTMLTYTAIL